MIRISPARIASRFNVRPTAALALFVLVIALAATDASRATAPPPAKGTDIGSPPVDPAVDPKWLDKLPKDDRAAIDDIIGFAPPPIPAEGLKWLPDQKVSWNDLRGKVIVIQSWTTGTTAGRKWPARIATAMKDFEPKDVRIFALHTPEEAAGAEEFMKKQKPPENVPIIIDEKGAFCDALGIYKQPVNIVIDRNGTVRYAGLNASGLEQAVKALVAETYDAKKIPQVKPEEKPAPSTGEFPPYSGTVDSARDIRGKRAPEFYVKDWVTTKPNPEGKVVVIDFWATWCHFCIEGLPHMNDLAKQLGDRVCFIGLSSESEGDFTKGMSKLKQTKSITIKSFQYPIALDSTNKMYGSIDIRGIPHCIVMSKDWTVRWQGNPKGLTAQTLQQIVAADGGTVKGPATRRRGWVKS